MHATPILQYLQKHGQCLDSEIATATWISLPAARTSLSDLLARGEISRCSVTRFTDDKPVEEVPRSLQGLFHPRRRAGNRAAASKPPRSPQNCVT